ncbi:hypothetical protein MMC14_009806 [Varicellaria rhodocarpa]|nr:hypothetical protein [Varicellaria rhodocarpa]
MVKPHVAYGVLAAGVTYFAAANPIPGPGAPQSVMCSNNPSVSVGNLDPSPTLAIASRDNPPVDLMGDSFDDGGLDPDFAHLLLPRKGARAAPSPQVLWCIPGTRTFLRLNTTSVFLNSTPPSPSASSTHSPTVFASFVQYLQLRIQAQIAIPPTAKSDGVIATPEMAAPGGMSLQLKSPTSNWELNMWNEKSHQATWGVLGAAVKGLQAFDASLAPGYIRNGTLNFDLYDGAYQVGYGNVMTV